MTTQESHAYATSSYDHVESKFQNQPKTTLIDVFRSNPSHLKIKHDIEDTDGARTRFQNQHVKDKEESRPIYDSEGFYEDSGFQNRSRDVTTSSFSKFTTKTQTGEAEVRSRFQNYRVKDQAEFDERSRPSNRRPSTSSSPEANAARNGIHVKDREEFAEGSRFQNRPSTGSSLNLKTKPQTPEANAARNRIHVKDREEFAEGSRFQNRPSTGSSPKSNAQVTDTPNRFQNQSLLADTTHPTTTPSMLNTSATNNRTQSTSATNRTERSTSATNPTERSTSATNRTERSTSATNPTERSISATNRTESTSATNRTYIQCYSHQANRHLVDWADQMSIALRDSVAHLDLICMRVRNCLSDLEANEIRYLHMQRRPSPIQLCTTSVPSQQRLAGLGFDLNGGLCRSSDRVMEVDKVVNEVEVEVEPRGDAIEIEGLPRDTPVILEPDLVPQVFDEPSVKQPTSRKPKSPRGSRTNCKTPPSPRSTTPRPTTPRPTTAQSRTSTTSPKPSSSRIPAANPRIAPIHCLRPIMTVREHIELCKHPQLFKQKSLVPSSTMAKGNHHHHHQQQQQPQQQQQQPKSILKTSSRVVNRNECKGLTNRQHRKGDGSGKYSESLWFKSGKVQEPAIVDPHCNGCKVIVECPRVPSFSHPPPGVGVGGGGRGSYNAQSRLQWIRAKNSLVLEYGRQHAADNGNSTSSVQHSTDILDEISGDLVQPLNSEYPRRDRAWESSADAAFVEEVGEDGLLRELLEDPKRMQVLVRSPTSHRSLQYRNHHFQHNNRPQHPIKAPSILLNSINRINHNRNNSAILAPPLTPILAMPTINAAAAGLVEYSKAAQLHKLHMQHRRLRRSKKKQKKQHEMLKDGSVMGLGQDGGDLKIMRKKSSGKGRSSGDKENDQVYHTWANMKPHEIKAKLMPYLIPNEQRVYTVLPLVDIIYDKKPPKVLPPWRPTSTSINAGQKPNVLHLGNSSLQPKVEVGNSRVRVRGGQKQRGLYTDAASVKKLEAYLELTDHAVVPKSNTITTVTAMPALTITTPYNSTQYTSGRKQQHYNSAANFSHQNGPITNKDTINNQTGRNKMTTTMTSSVPTKEQVEDESDGFKTAREEGEGVIVELITSSARGEVGKDDVQEKVGKMTERKVGLCDSRLRRGRSGITAATRKDIGTSIQQIEDKLAELISDPKKRRGGQAFDDVEKDIMSMLEKITNVQEEATATSGNAITETSDEDEEMIADEAKCVSKMFELLTTEENLTTDVVNSTEVINLTSTETEKSHDLITRKTSSVTVILERVQHMEGTVEGDQISEVFNYPKLDEPHQIGDLPETNAVVKSKTSIDLQSVNNDVSTINLIELESFRELTKNLIETSNSLNTNEEDKSNTQILFELSNEIKHLEGVDSISPDSEKISSNNTEELKNLREEIANLCQFNDNASESKHSEKMTLKDGPNVKPDKNSKCNLNSTTSDQFVTPYMRKVRKYRKDETHDNFLQFLDALTHLSQDNIVFDKDSKNQEIQLNEQLSNISFNKETTVDNIELDNNHLEDLEYNKIFEDRLKEDLIKEELTDELLEVMFVSKCDSTITEKNSEINKSNSTFTENMSSSLSVNNQQSINSDLAIIKEVPNNTNLSHCNGDQTNFGEISEAKALLKSTDSICTKLVDYILRRCQYRLKRRLLRCRKSDDVATWQDGVLKTVYTAFFAMVFLAMRLDWNCVS